MKKRYMLIIAITLLMGCLIVIYKYNMGNNKKVNIYAEKIFFLAQDACNDLDYMKKAETVEQYNEEAKELIINLYELQTSLDSGNILLTGDYSNSISAVDFSFNTLLEEIQYNNKSNILGEVESVVNWIYEELNKYREKEMNISKKELIVIIDESLSRLRFAN